MKTNWNFSMAQFCDMTSKSNVLSLWPRPSTYEGQYFLEYNTISFLYKFQINISSNSREIKYQNIGRTHRQTHTQTRWKQYLATPSGGEAMIEYWKDGHTYVLPRITGLDQSEFCIFWIWHMCVNPGKLDHDHSARVFWFGTIIQSSTQRLWVTYPIWERSLREKQRVCIPPIGLHDMFHGIVL